VTLQWEILVWGLNEIAFAHPPYLIGKEFLFFKRNFPERFIGLNGKDVFFGNGGMFDDGRAKYDVKIMIAVREHTVIIETDGSETLFRALLQIIFVDIGDVDVGFEGKEPGDIRPGAAAQVEDFVSFFGFQILFEKFTSFSPALFLVCLKPQEFFDFHLTSKKSSGPQFKVKPLPYLFGNIDLTGQVQSIIVQANFGCQVPPISKFP